MNRLGDVPLAEGFHDALEENLRAYASERPDDHRVLAALRKMPHRWAGFLLSIRDHAKRTTRWMNDPADPMREHSEGLFEAKVHGVKADIKGVKTDAPRPWSCDQCEGTRWMRMTNHRRDAIEVQTDNPLITHTYGPEESYLVPCDSCSKDRGRRYRGRAPLGERTSAKKKTETAFEED